MYFVFKDLFGNNLYDAIINDTVEISDALYALPKRDTLHENCNSADAEYNSGVGLCIWQPPFCRLPACTRQNGSLIYWLRRNSSRRLL